MLTVTVVPHSGWLRQLFCGLFLFWTGTDATHAEHIETIKSRMYVGVRPDGKFVPGQLGMGLVEGKSLTL